MKCRRCHHTSHFLFLSKNQYANEIKRNYVIDAIKMTLLIIEFVFVLLFRRKYLRWHPEFEESQASVTPKQAPTMSIKRMSTQQLLAGTFLLLLTCVSAFNCPDQCSCIEVQRNRHSYNHAKCTSLDGLRQLGKTSDIHSLDLSNITLTKITNQLDKLTNLTKIDLHDNRLSEINSLSSKRVRILNLSNNRITSGKLTKIPIHVKHLNLSHNDITYLPLDFKKLIHLKTLELADNPLNCTCDTLEVRNWLQEKHVWTDKPILCMAPLQFKGRSWLQIRQSDVCESNGLDEPRTLPYAHADDENDLMLGDDPNALASLEANDEHEEELGTDFLPVHDHAKNKEPGDEHVELAPIEEDDEEHNISEDFDLGSGDDDDSFEEHSTTTTPDVVAEALQEQYEGSGDDLPELRHFAHDLQEQNDTSAEDSATVIPIEVDEFSKVTEQSVSTEPETTPSESSTVVPDVPVVLLASSDEKVVVKDANSESSTTSSTTETASSPSTSPAAVVEEKVQTEKALIADAEIIHPDAASKNNNASNSAPVKSETPAANNQSPQKGSSTFILLGILGLLLLILILYVAISRNRQSSKNRNNNNDVENPAQELLTMDKNNLGKPIQNNGTEFIPLIPGKYPVDKENNLSNAQEPLLKKLSENEGDHNNSSTTNEPDDATEQDSQPQQNGGPVVAAVPVQNGVPKDTDVNDNKDFQAISPKPSRYSPVS